MLLYTTDRWSRSCVLVQREMENWRSPLASIPPSSAGQLGEHRARQWRLLNWAAAETATGFKKGKKTLSGRALTQPAGGEETNWLGKKTVTARPIILPAKRLPCGQFPKCRFHVQ